MKRRFTVVPTLGVTASSYVKTSYNSWTDAYGKIEEIIDTYFPDTDRINSEVDKFYQRNSDDPMVRAAYKRWQESAEDVELTDEDMERVWEIADRYNTSRPISGDWSTETQHEQKAISDELGLSMYEAKRIMIDELGFTEDMF